MIAGVDGCKGGWVVAMADGWYPGVRGELFVCEDFKGVLARIEPCKVIVVDMPIGIPSGSQCRDCDVQAREELGRAASRVFLTPPRGCLQAAKYQEFLEVHRKLRGKGVSKQTWAIVPKIKEVDETMTPALQDKVFEYHPELAWKYLAGRVLDSKHRIEGILERVGIVEKYAGGIGKFVWHDEIKNAKIDDVLDAIVGLSVADGIVKGPDCNRRLLWQQPPKDAQGLRMEIWF